MPKVNRIDLQVGTRIRSRRIGLGMSQERLAHALGVSFQQVQKYEGGVNRVAASRLLAAARILGVPTAFFFEDISRKEKPARDAAVPSGPADDVVRLNRAFGRIGDKQLRRSIIAMIDAAGRDLAQRAGAEPPQKSTPKVCE